MLKLEQFDTGETCDGFGLFYSGKREDYSIYEDGGEYVVTQNHYPIPVFEKWSDAWSKTFRADTLSEAIQIIEREEEAK